MQSVMKTLECGQYNIMLMISTQETEINARMMKMSRVSITLLI